ncbi:unnamed protein product, partial [Echinostoma caproni]|uniref:Wax2_C domain-containing protein n=1 Tax=Echinostoma caproni TaxID=27848 RepID=A0A183APC6_9TREM
VNYAVLIWFSHSATSAPIKRHRFPCSIVGLCHSGIFYLPPPIFTKWNKLGYEVAEIFTPKFDLISPVWFQILGRKKSYTVSGIPNVDNWIRRLHHRNPTVKVVPRFIFEDWTAEDYSLTLKDSSKTKAYFLRTLSIERNIMGLEFLLSVNLNWLLNHGCLHSIRVSVNG